MGDRRLVCPKCGCVLWLKTCPNCVGEVEDYCQPSRTDTLWRRCFCEVYETAKRTGATTVKFSDVDALVMKKANLGIDKLLKFLND